MSRSLLLAVLATLLLFTPAVQGAGDILCTCRCCYQGDCTALVNVSWDVDSCDACSTTLCNQYIASSEVKQKTARLFESLQNDVPAAAKTDLQVDVCEVITVLETATCSGGQCKRSTNMRAECYNRNAPLMKYMIQSFVGILIGGVVFGFVKNYIPALQGLNTRYFNY